MKNRLITLLTVGTLVITTSCAKKDYTCECTITESDGITSDTYTTSHTITNVTKLEALADCPKSDYQNNNGYIYDKKCALQ